MWKLSFMAISHGQTYQNDFLNIGIGARGQAMMGANIASNQDVFSTYWNPANLSRLSSPLEVGAMHAEWFTGVVKHDYLGVAKQLDTSRKEVGAFSVIRNGVDNIPNTLNLYDANGAINYDNISEFSFVSYAIFLSYSRQIFNERWSLGGNAKLLLSQAGPFGKAFGIGIDAGISYKHQGLVFAISARDITTTYNRWTYSFTDEEQRVLVETGNELISGSTEITRPSLLPAVGYEKKFEQYSVLVEGMAHITFDGQRNVLLSSKTINVAPAIGTEVGYKQVVFLRAGLGNFQRVNRIGFPGEFDWNMRPAFGVGLKLGKVRIDYALTNVGNTANNRYSHIFSAIVGFSPRKTSAQ